MQARIPGWLWNKETEAGGLVRPRPGCVAWGRLLGLFEPQLFQVETPVPSLPAAGSLGKGRSTQTQHRVRHRPSLGV